MNKFKNILLTYSVVFILFSFLYFLLFHSRLFANETVLFYRGVFLLLISGLFFLSIVIFVYFKIPKINIESLIAAVVVSIAIHLSLFIVFPVTFERSVTMYILSSLKNNQSSPICSGLTKNQIEKLLIKDYIINKKAVDKRVEEQSIINFIKIRKNCIQITPKALSFLNYSEIVKKLYNIK